MGKRALSKVENEPEAHLHLPHDVVGDPAYAIGEVVSVQGDFLGTLAVEYFGGPVSAAGGARSRVGEELKVGGKEDPEHRPYPAPFEGICRDCQSRASGSGTRVLRVIKIGLPHIPAGDGH
jgi:hypothetical protein